MRNLTVRAAVTLAGATGWGADWLTDGADPERTNWQKNEKVFTTSNVKDTKLLWKIKLDNEPRQMHALFPPLIVERVNTAGGPKQIAVVAGVSDNIYAIDVAKGMHEQAARFSASPIRIGNLPPGG